MLSWETQLGPADIQKVASFVLSLQGTTPADPKAPQGELYVEAPVQEVAPATEGADTTTTEGTQVGGQ